MAAGSKKDKLIEEAQKLILRGQFEKAVRIHEQLLALEPSAINQRQKVAELLLKVGRLEDARREFEIIGSYYAKNGFYLKAIAVYKQLQKLFPADILLTLTLAEQNEKHGLVANALYEYQRVYDFYTQAGSVAEAIRILDRMQNVDPQNIPVKLKLAESYLQHGKHDESYKLFSRSASMLQERGEQSLLDRLATRIQQLFPEKTDFVLEVLAEQVNAGNAVGTIDRLQKLLRNDPTNKRIWDLVITAYKQLNQPQRLKMAYQHYLKYFPAEPSSMAGLIECLISERELVAALELLDRYEPDLVSAGFQQEREAIYRSLAELDPLNLRILKGLTGIITAQGKTSEAEMFNARLRALEISSVVSPFDNLTSEADIEQATEEMKEEDTDAEVENVCTGTPAEAEADEEIEIEIDIEDDSVFDTEPDAGTIIAGQSDWLDSSESRVGAAGIEPRSVKFNSEIDNSDAQSHFDLGLAFKEMGLYDEARKEFHNASLDPQHRNDSLIMQAACLRERGEVEKSLDMLQALLIPGMSQEDTCAVHYELAITYDAMGHTQEATSLLNEISARCPGFRDVSSRLNAANLESTTLDFSEEELQGFGPK